MYIVAGERQAQNLTGLAYAHTAQVSYVYIHWSCLRSHRPDSYFQHITPEWKLCYVPDPHSNP
jgi:hypothetical protein